MYWETFRRDPGKADMISEQTVRDELFRILESLLLVQADRLGRFLRFTLEMTLERKAGTLKEHLIGTEGYGRC